MLSGRCPNYNTFKGRTYTVHKAKKRLYQKMPRNTVKSPPDSNEFNVRGDSSGGVYSEIKRVAKKIKDSSLKLVQKLFSFD